MPGVDIKYQVSLLQNATKISCAFLFCALGQAQTNGDASDDADSR